MSFFDSMLEIIVGLFAKNEVSVSIPVGQSSPKVDSPKIADKEKSMSFTLTHNRFCAAGIFGQLCEDGGAFVAYTLEHSYDNKPKLADGEYTCVRGIHHLGPELKEINTFEIKGIPQFQGKNVTGVLFHPGNYNFDSAGCVLLGNSETDLMVASSKEAFAGFLKMVDGLDSFHLTVKSS
jgi:hypothetical protein